MTSANFVTPISFAGLTHTGQYTDSNPYGVAMVAAYVKKSFGDSVDIKLYKYPTELAADLDKSIPPIICFSIYVWNFRLSYEFARRIKDKSPETIIIFGGPNFPLIQHEQESFLREFPLIDFFVFREGEIALTQLLENLFENDFDVGQVKKSSLNLQNCIYLHDDKLVVNTSAPPIANLDSLPSPYLMGLCDKLLDDERISPLIQIARGCPFKCSFCQEGEEFYNKVRRFSLDRIKKELRYIAERTRSPVLQVADSNFAMYKFDLEVCHEIAKIQKEFDWPKFVADFSGKNQKERVLNAVEILHGSHNLVAAVQSTDPDVLKAVKRSNINSEQMIHVAHRSKEIDASSFAEVILALPADTKEAHFKSMSDLIDANLNVVRSHQFIMLLGSSGCSIQERATYGMETRFRVMPNTVVPYTLFGDTFYAPEIDEICVGNSTLSFDDYLECRLFDLTVELFYNNAIFEELYEFVAQSGLSISKLIRNIYVSFCEKDGALQEIKEGFLKETRELWDSSQELEDALKDPVMIDQIEKGEIGINEQIIFRTRAVFQHLEDLHDLAFDNAKKLMIEANLFNEKSDNYLTELLEISLMRKADILSLDKSYSKKFNFNFIQLDAQKFKVNPDEYFDHSGFDIVVSHTDEQKELIDQYTDQYGISENGLGYILSSVSNFNKFYRELH